jgi:hypothetical protein
MITYAFVKAPELKHYQVQLEAFEKEFVYHLGSECFSVSHGKDYGAYFSLVGTPFTLLVENDRHIIGCLTVIEKKIAFSGSYYSALYIGDLKISKSYQLTGLSSHMFSRLAFGVGSHYSLHEQALIYFIALQTPSGGDFTRIKGKYSPLTLFATMAILNLYMIPPELLARIEVSDLNEKIGADFFLNLAPNNGQPLFQRAFVNLIGKKDFLKSGIPLKIAHLTLGTHTNKELLHVLKNAGNEAVDNGFNTCFFALDARRGALRDYLKQQAVKATVPLKVYGLAHATVLKNAMPIIAFDTYQM